jgi:hypothetical protein
MDSESRAGVPQSEQKRRRRRQTKDEAHDIRHPDVSPPAPIETEENAGKELHGDDNQEARFECRQELRWYNKLETEQVGKCICRRENHSVKKEENEDAGARKAM